MTSIAGLAFVDCSSLTDINIPDGVTKIYCDTFRGCSSLTNVTIPDSVASIDSYAFRYCTSLADITFDGTKAQWKAIEKGIGWNINAGDFVVRCTDGDLDKDGNEI